MIDFRGTWSYVEDLEPLEPKRFIFEVRDWRTDDVLARHVVDDAVAALILDLRKQVEGLRASLEDLSHEVYYGGSEDD